VAQLTPQEEVETVIIESCEGLNISGLFVSMGRKKKKIT